MNTQKSAVIISLFSDTDEISQLVTTLDYTVIKIIVQQRIRPDVNYYVGAGKVKEIQEYLETLNEIPLIIVNGELKPSQWYTLEKTLHATVYDRIHLILTIFEQRAQRKEARLQVKLAQLQYERPNVRELIHRARAGEHPGLMAGGEYQVDDYYETIKKQMKTIRLELKKIRTNRELHRKTRNKSGFYMISLAGYTNAGKSSLLNLLSGGNVKVEGKLFSTLSTTTRRIPKKYQAQTMPILLTDTVGFIDNLPSWIIDAFHSTLEEIEVADMVILVVDASESFEVVLKKLMVSLTELVELNVTSPVLIALNKTDLISEQQLSELLVYLQNSNQVYNKLFIPLSVHNNTHIDDLFSMIYKLLPQKTTLHITLPNNPQSQRFISQIYNQSQVNHISYAELIQMDISCNSVLRDKIIAQLQDIKGSVLEEETKVT